MKAAKKLATKKNKSTTIHTTHLDPSSTLQSIKCVNYPKRVLSFIHLICIYCDTIAMLFFFISVIRVLKFRVVMWFHVCCVVHSQFSSVQFSLVAFSMFCVCITVLKHPANWQDNRIWFVCVTKQRLVSSKVTIFIIIIIITYFLLHVDRWNREVNVCLNCSRVKHTHTHKQHIAINRFGLSIVK